MTEVHSGLVVPNESGESYTTRYLAINAMLLNELLMEHRKGQAATARCKLSVTSVKSAVFLC